VLGDMTSIKTQLVEMARKECLNTWSIDINIWISNHQSQGQANLFACDVTNRSKIPWNRYTYIARCLFFVLN